MSSIPRAPPAAPRLAQASRTTLASRPVQMHKSSNRGVSTSAWFKFGLGGETAETGGIIGAQGRDDFDKDDVEQYFNYMGLLAVEGSYDNMWAMMKSGLHSADILLIWASQEGDLPKLEELINAGADPNAKDHKGRTALSVAGENNETKKDDVLAILNSKN
mmetsp:Transcript_25501/g.48296  ORF Transcript_25501/g.48296 Transcript_25501/m.48296 type:complete len:161 (+) Transcript_25501:1-483(+)